MNPNKLDSIAAKIETLNQQPELVSPNCKHIPFNISKFLFCLFLGFGLLYLVSGLTIESTALLSGALILSLSLVFSIPFPSTSSFLARLTLNLSFFLFCVYITSEHQSLDSALRYLTTNALFSTLSAYLTLTVAASAYRIALHDALRCLHHSLALSAMLKNYPTLFTPSEKRLLAQVNTQHLQTIQLLAEYRVQSQKTQQLNS